MKLLQQTNKVESNLGQTKRLNIAATSTAFRILSKNLYSRPYEAVIKEYACNAFDAHISNNCPNRPIEIYLPTYENQKLIIRDYGTGIPPEKVVDIFATYFTSTKNDDNSVIGCLGLGSKSAFAVSDQLIVEIWYGGKHYYWNIFKDEEGFPSIPDGTYTLCEDSDEETGVRITIPTNDIYAFESAAQQILQYFDPLPIVWKGKNKVEIKPPVKSSKYKHFWVEPGYGVNVLMGNICYPIDTGFTELNDFNVLNPYAKIIVPMEIGDVDFSASRESLEYNKRTLRNLQNKLQEIKDDLSVSIQEGVDKEKNAFNAQAYFNDLSLSMDLKRVLFKELTYQNKLLSSYFQDHNYTNSIKDKDNHEIQKFLKSKATYGKRKYENVGYTGITKKVNLYYNDVKTRLVNSHFSQAPQNSFIFNDANLIDKWCEANFYDREDILPISSLPFRKIESFYESRPTAGLFKINGGSRKNSFWASVDKAPDFGYYFVKSVDDVLIGENKKFLEDWRFLVDNKLIPTDHPIFGISKSYLKYYADWEPIVPKIIENLEKLRDKLELTLSNQNEDFIRWHDVWPDGELKNKLKIIKSYDQTIYRFNSIYSFFDISLKEKKELKIDSKTIYKKYPLLASLDEHINKKELQHYLKLVDDSENNSVKSPE
jgi:hypothetical protein